MEKVTGTDPTIDVFENDIDMYLKDFLDREGMEDFRQIGQSIWNSALRHVYNNVFKPNKDILKSHVNVNIPGNSIPSNCNSYNYDLLNDICDYYIYNMCMRYNKEVSILGFTILTGIDQETIHGWNNNNNYGSSNKLSSLASKIYKKLHDMREESLSNKLSDGNKNPIGAIAILNRHYGWSSPYCSDSNKNRQSLTAAELPKLSQNGVNINGIPQIDN